MLDPSVTHVHSRCDWTVKSLKSVLLHSTSVLLHTSASLMGPLLCHALLCILPVPSPDIDAILISKTQTQPTLLTSRPCLSAANLCGMYKQAGPYTCMLCTTKINYP